MQLSPRLPARGRLSASRPAAAGLMALAVLLLLPLSRAAADDRAAAAVAPRASFTLGIQRLSGSTAYRIGGRVRTAHGDYDLGYFPISELKFRQEAWLVAAGAGFEPRPGLLLSLKLAGSASRQTGQTEDSDWLSDGILDIFSLTDTRAAFATLDLKASLRLSSAPAGSVWASAGLLRQHFGYELSALRQWSPSGRYPQAAVSIDGPVGTYEVDYIVPYAELTVAFDPRPDLRFELSAGISPRAFARDADDHLLRKKLSRGSGTGLAVLLAARGRWRLAGRLSGLLDVGYTAVAASGAQEQVFYEDTEEAARGTAYILDQTIGSRHLSAALSLGLEF